MSERKWNALAILNVLMNANDYVSTKQIINKVGCDRKAVYNSVAILETNGFGIEIVRHPHKENTYKYVGIFGL